MGGKSDAITSKNNSLEQSVGISRKSLAQIAPSKIARVRYVTQLRNFPPTLGGWVVRILHRYLIVGSSPTGLTTSLRRYLTSADYFIFISRETLRRQPPQSAASRMPGTPHFSHLLTQISETHATFHRPPYIEAYRHWSTGSALI